MKTQSHILPLAIAQFRKDWPFMAVRLDSMRERATGADGGERSAPTAAAPAALSLHPHGNHGNHGDNKFLPTTGGVK